MQHNKPAASHSYKDPPLSPLHPSRATFTSMSSISSESEDSKWSFSGFSMTDTTAASSHHGHSSFTHLALDGGLEGAFSQKSSQNTLHQKYQGHESNYHYHKAHEYSQSQYSGCVGSPTPSLHPSCDYHARPSKPVARSLNSYSSIDSQEHKIWGSKRLFERAPQKTACDGPLMVLPTACIKAVDEESDKELQVLEEYDDMTQQLTADSNFSLTEYYATISSSYSHKEYKNHQKSQLGPSPGNLHNANIFSHHPKTHNQQLPTEVKDDTYHSTFSEESLEVDYDLRSPQTAYSNLCSPISYSQESPRSDNSPDSDRNSFMNATAALNLQLDSVIHCALVESSTHHHDNHATSSPDLTNDTAARSSFLTTSQRPTTAAQTHTHCRPNMLDLATSSNFEFLSITGASLDTRANSTMLDGHEEGAKSAAHAANAKHDMATRFGSGMKRLARKMAL